MTFDPAKIPLRLTRCKQCRNPIMDIRRNPKTGRWNRAPKRVYCSEACMAESLSRGGNQWLHSVGAKRTLWLLGLEPERTPESPRP